MEIKVEGKDDNVRGSDVKTCDVSYLHKDTLKKNLLVTSNDLDSLYHIISPNLENSDINSLLEQRLNANQDANIVEQMFKIQIAIFCKNGPFSVDNEELRNELTEIKESISEQFSDDLSKSIDVISKWSENDQNKKKFLDFVLNSCE
ncbi:Hypothetical protein Nlim_1065 [Candidatus Nitrosarchaeum limnium SFB1]|uniref:Uncharacterized protein n=1 Tax=Candidatus Nitrosarchaeum limnium SFB1 TaxID=886738 RepID=F3KKP1_9ARCH|nr:Hypothetical protein Nlim_1065 [Candidatus Nitrosarchaeum limnium SFB1]